MADNFDRAQRLKEEGNAHFRSKDFRKAIEIYTKCLSMKDLDVFYNNRAAAYMKEGMYDMAIFDLINVLEFQTNQKAMKRRVFALHSLNRVRDAHDALKEYLERFSDESEELRSLTVDIYQIVRNRRGKFDSLAILKATDGVTAILNEDLNGNCILYDLEKQKSTVKEQLAAHPIELILIHGVALDREITDLLSQIDSACLRDSPSSKVEISDVNFSLMPKGTFNELFGGLLRPNRLSFFAVRGIDGCFFVRNVKNFGSKYVEVMPIEKAKNPIVNMMEFIECIGSRNFGICPKPLVFRTNQHLFDLKIDEIVNKLHEAFQMDRAKMTYRLVIFCRLADVHKWIQELFRGSVLKGDDIERMFDMLFRNTTPEEIINDYNQTARFVVKIRRYVPIEMEMIGMLDRNVKCNEFNVSVQIYCEI